jgi:hypothetical protein
MIRTAVVIVLVGFALTACLQSRLFGCKQSPHPYCPAPGGPPASHR